MNELIITLCWGRQWRGVGVGGLLLLPPPGPAPARFPGAGGLDLAPGDQSQMAGTGGPRGGEGRCRRHLATQRPALCAVVQGKDKRLPSSTPSVELCAGLPTSREQKLLRSGLHAHSRALLV